MADIPSLDSGAYQTLSDIRERVDYDGDELYNDNAQLRFDELLVRLERESRKIFETLWGDETPLTQTGRTDIKRATDDAALLLVYPVNDVTKVERKTSLDADWDELDSDWYDFTDHRLILTRGNPSGRVRHDNSLARPARRGTWRDIAVKLRITYDRGFGSEPPADIQSIQVALINNMIRKLRREQNVAAARPEDFAGTPGDMDDVLTDSLRQRINDVTKPGGATMSV